MNILTIHTEKTSMNTSFSFWETLPLYPDGAISETVYLAGEGLNDSRSIEHPGTFSLFAQDETLDEKTFLSRVTTWQRLHKPYHYIYGGIGHIKIGFFENEQLILADFDGTHVHLSFLDDYQGTHSSPSYAATVSNTTKDTFEQYMSILPNHGGNLVYTHEAEDNLYREFRFGNGILNCSFHPSENLVRLIWDTSSTVSVDQFGYSAPQGKTEIYSFSLMHGRMVGGFSCDCGMCYLIKLGDNSLVMIDGGEMEQCTYASTEALWSFMHEITNTEKDGTIRIAAWYCTHAHDDHADMFGHIISLYRDKINLQRVMFNFPAKEYSYIAPQLYMTINRINHFYPHVQYRKLHAGDSFDLANTHFDVLQTHEQGLGEGDDGYFRSMNDSSTVLKISFDQGSFLVLGDIDEKAEDILLLHYTDATLHCNLVQAAHHLFNMLNRLYDVVKPDYCIVPQNEECRTNNNSRKYACISRNVKPENILFDDMGSFGFRMENGQLTPFFHAEPIGTLYDSMPL